MRNNENSGTNVEQEVFFQKMVKALAKPGVDILATLTPEKVHLLHMAIGITDEIRELGDAVSSENVLEELGDVLFYVEGIESVLFITEEEYANADYFYDSDSVLDVVKKHVIYNKELDRAKLIKELKFVKHTVEIYADVYGFTREQILQHNIEKLSKRYGKSYSDKAAQERKDKQE